MSRTFIDGSLIPSAFLNAPNIVINGGMEIWQRGTSFVNPANAAYTADRWACAFGGGTPTMTITKDTGTFDTGLASFKSVISALNSATIIVFQQSIENYSELAGKTVSFSMRIKSSVANSISLRIIDSSGGTNSSTNVGTNFETLTVTRTLSAGITSLTVEFGMRAVAAQLATFFADSGMLVSGSFAAPYPQTDPQIELARCQRYYQRIGGNISGNELVASGQCWSTTRADFTVRLPVVMRVTPTITSVGVSGWRIYDAAGNGVTTTSLGSFASSVQMVGLTPGVASGLVAGNGSIIYTTATTSYLEVSAEF